MSASREKKKRQEFVANGGVDAKAAQEAAKRAADKRSTILYTTLAIAFVALAVFLLVYNSGVLQRNRTAVTIDGENYTAADAAYYYGNAYQSFMTQNGQLASLLIDPNKSLKDQQAYGSEDQTWDDYFKDQAVTSMKFVHAVLNAAQAEDITLDDEAMEIYNSSLEGLKAQATANGMSYKAFLTAMYGPLMTPSVYEENLKDGILANTYIDAHQDSLSFSDQEIQTYYEENKNSFDLVDGGYVSISGSPETKKDEEGNTIEATDEEKAAAMAEAKEKAEAILADYQTSGDLQAAADANEATYTGGKDLRYTSGTAMDWLFDASRKAGDAQVLTDEEGSRVYVAVFNGRQRNEYPSYDIRHILVGAESLELPEGEEATSAQILAKAEELLADWDGTEEGFATLANEHSIDGGSNTNGGLYEDVAWGQMVSEFNDWCYAEGRKAGDTGIVTSAYGSHIMYFVGYGDEQYWHSACENQLLSKAMNDWQTQLIDSVTAEVKGGMNAVG